MQKCGKFLESNGKTGWKSKKIHILDIGGYNSFFVENPIQSLGIGIEPRSENSMSRNLSCWDKLICDPFLCSGNCSSY